MQAGEAIQSVGHGFPTIALPTSAGLRVLHIRPVKGRDRQQLIVNNQLPSDVIGYPHEISFTAQRRSLPIAHLVPNERAGGIGWSWNVGFGHCGELAEGWAHIDLPCAGEKRPIAVARP
jgi:hypothetical protein